jgi:hypothetical protein
VSQTPRPSRTYDAIDVPEFVRDGIRAGLTPDQIYARNGKRRVVYLAGIIEEARVKAELASLDPTPAKVAALRDSTTTAGSGSPCAFSPWPPLPENGVLTLRPR